MLKTKLFLFCVFLVFASSCKKEDTKPEPPEETKIIAKSVRLDTTNVEVEIGAVYTLKATINPRDVEDKTLTWNSSNESVATVDSQGVVTSISKGIANIIVSTANGVKDTCKITVKTLEELVTFSLIYERGGSYNDDIRFKGFGEVISLKTSNKASDKLYIKQFFAFNDLGNSFAAGDIKKWVESGQTKQVEILDYVTDLKDNSIIEYPANIFFTYKGDNYKAYVVANEQTITKL